MKEYIYTPDMPMPKLSKNIKVHKISSNAVLFELCKNSGCDIEIADDGEDILFAVDVRCLVSRHNSGAQAHLDH